MTTQPSFSTLRAAIAAEDMGRIIEEMDRVDRRFAADRARDRREHAIAVVVLDALSSNDPTRSIVRDYFETTTRVESARIDFQQSVLEFVFELTEGTELFGRIDDLIDAYGTQRLAFSAIESERVSHVLPPIITLGHLGDIDIPAGKVANQRVTVRNDGDRPAAVQVSLDSTLAGQVDPRVIDSLEPEQESELSVDIEGSTPGPHHLTLTVATDTTGDAIDWRITVIGKTEWIDRGIGIITQVTGNVSTDVTGRRGFNNQLNEISRRLARISRDIERDRRPIRAIDRSLQSVERRVVAIKKSAPSSMSDDLTMAMTDDKLAKLRETIERAVEADTT